MDNIIQDLQRRSPDREPLALADLPVPQWPDLNEQPQESEKAPEIAVVKTSSYTIMTKKMKYSWG